MTDFSKSAYSLLQNEGRLTFPITVKFNAANHIWYFFLRSFLRPMEGLFRIYVGRKWFPAGQNQAGRRNIVILRPPKFFFDSHPPGTIYRPLKFGRGFFLRSKKIIFEKYSKCAWCVHLKISKLSQYEVLISYNIPQ